MPLWPIKCVSQHNRAAEETCAQHRPQERWWFHCAQVASVKTVPGEFAALETRNLEKPFSSVIMCLTGLRLEISSKNKGIRVAV